MFKLLILKRLKLLILKIQESEPQVSAEPFCFKEVLKI